MLLHQYDSYILNIGKFRMEVEEASDNEPCVWPCAWAFEDLLTGKNLEKTKITFLIAWPIYN